MENNMFKVKEVMITDVITVKRKTEIYEAINTLVENNITGLPVVNDDMTVAGIITEKDVLRLLYDMEDKPGYVEDFMSEYVICFDQEESLIDVTEHFIKNDYRRVPILKEGKLVGILSRKDVIACILKLRHKSKAAV
jgi:CBS domain-containing protein